MLLPMWQKKNDLEGSPFFFFQLQFTFNTILYQFQVYRIVVRQSHTLRSDSPKGSLF